MSKFLKISKVRGHGDWAIFEGFWKCSCCLTGTRYTASTGIVVFKETHSTSPCTKLMKFEMSKFLKISKVRGHGDWVIFEGFLKCSCWLTGTRYTASTVSLCSLGPTLQVHALNSWSLKCPNFWKYQRSGVMAIERFLKVSESAPVASLEHGTPPALVSLCSRRPTLQVHALNSWSLKCPNFWKYQRSGVMAIESFLKVS